MAERIPQYGALNAIGAVRQPIYVRDSVRKLVHAIGADRGLPGLLPSLSPSPFASPSPTVSLPSPRPLSPIAVSSFPYTSQPTAPISADA